jgi:hypothetical protein
VELSRFPQISKPCKSMIGKLLEKESPKRLGSAHGAADLKNHPFFDTINWSRMLDKALPRRIQPAITR